MKLDSKALFDLMSEFHVIGDDAYGGMSTREEDILVGYVYGILTENHESRAIVDNADRKVFKFGDYSYIVWFDEVDEDGEEEEETYDYVQRVEYEETDEDAFAGDEFEEDEDEGYEELEEEFEETLYPVAIEGPFTDREIEEKIRIGEL